MPLTIEDLAQQARDVALTVHAAQEQSDDRERVIAAHMGVERLSTRYRELCENLGESERLKVERTVGRRVTDLMRLVSLLPKVGSLAASTPDRQVAGRSEVGERRITGVSWRTPQRAGAPELGAAHKVGGEVDAWCGPCEGMTTHRIIAIVGREPKQVVCDACGGRHGYRTSPARKTNAGLPNSVGVEGFRSTSSQELEAQRKAEQKAAELRVLSKELAAVENVRSWDPKQRYRPGDVISHPEFGRGKVETILRSSLLVRFSIGGLKSLMTI